MEKEDRLEYIRQFIEERDQAERRKNRGIEKFFKVIFKILWVILGILIQITNGWMILVIAFVLIYPLFALFKSIGFGDGQSVFLSCFLIFAITSVILGLIIVRSLKRIKEKKELYTIYKALVKRAWKRDETEDFIDDYGEWEDRDGQENVKKMNPMRRKYSQHYEGKPEDSEDYYKKRWK